MAIMLKSSLCVNKTVTEPTKREACGSICRLLFINIVNKQAGSNNGKQVWYGQDTE